MAHAEIRFSGMSDFSEVKCHITDTQNWFFCSNWSYFENCLDVFIRLAGWSFSRIAVNLAYNSSVMLRYCPQNLNHHFYTCRPGSICQRCTDARQDRIMFKVAVIYSTVFTVYQTCGLMCANANHLKILTSSKMTGITQFALLHERRRTSLCWRRDRLEYCSVVLSDDIRFILYFRLRVSHIHP